MIFTQVVNPSVSGLRSARGSCSYPSPSFSFKHLDIFIQLICPSRSHTVRFLVVACVMATTTTATTALTRNILGPLTTTFTPSATCTLPGMALHDDGPVGFLAQVPTGFISSSCLTPWSERHLRVLRNASQASTLACKITRTVGPLRRLTMQSQLRLTCMSKTTGYQSSASLLCFGFPLG